MLQNRKWGVGGKLSFTPIQDSGGGGERALAMLKGGGGGG